MTDLIWHKPRKPRVTKCCASLRYRVAQHGDYCYECKTYSDNNIRIATAEDMRNNGINYTEEQFNEAYEK